MSIAQKILLWFLGLILVPTLLVGGLLFISFRSKLSGEVISHLEYTADVQQRRVEDIVNQNQQTLQAFTSRVLLPSTLARYNQLHHLADLTLLNDSLATAKNANDRYKDISILNQAGTAIASSDPALIGRDFSTKSYFGDAKQKNTAFNLFVDERGMPGIVLAGPIIYQDKSVGIIVIDTAADNLQTVVSDYSGLGNTGETQLAMRESNGDALFLTATRFDKSAALHRTVSHSDTDNPMIRAVGGKASISQDDKDHAGKAVISITRPITGTNWGIVVQIEQDEAYKPLSDLLDTIAILMLVILVLGVFTALYASRAITDPFIVISLAVRRISEGNLGARIELSSQERADNDEFGILERTINSMAKNLEKLDKMKTEFILLTSHQLRTPASAVKGFLALLLDDNYKTDAKDRKALLQGAYDENERQLHLINQILTISQAENNQMILTKSKVNLTKITKDVIRQVHSIVLSHDQKVTLHTPGKSLFVDGDPDKLAMIVENIITNASKYSPDDTEINVTLADTRSAAVIKVQDRGFGIAPEDMDQLFKKFSRLDNPNSIESQGSGLGLYLVKMLVELHGGTIEAKSGKGQGTTFVVRLPYK